MKGNLSAHVAKLARHLTCNQEIQGSNPCVCTFSVLQQTIKCVTLNFFYIEVQGQGVQSTNNELSLKHHVVDNVKARVMSDCVRHMMLSIANDMSSQFPLGTSFSAKQGVSRVLVGCTGSRLCDSICEDLTVKGFLRKVMVSRRRKVFYVLPFQFQKSKFSSAPIAFNYVKKEYLKCLKNNQNSGSLARYFGYISECTNGKSKNWLHFNICEILYNDGHLISFYMGNKRMFKLKESQVNNASIIHNTYDFLMQNLYKIWLCEFLVIVFLAVFETLRN